MEDIIRDIQRKIRDQEFPNEASVSQGIVLRLLHALGWNTFDATSVWPEYAIEGTRVDYALCHPHKKPVVFVEVKQLGKVAELYETQLANYTFTSGISVVVLTTGQEWNFYVPFGPGKFSDRRVYRLDLLERSVEEAVSRFRRYLSFDSWKDGSAAINAHIDLKEMLSDQETKRELPTAWNSLLTEPNPNLVQLLMDQVERKTGIGPKQSVVEDFLRSKGASTPAKPIAGPITTVKPSPPTSMPGTEPPSSRVTGTPDSGPRLVINGTPLAVHSYREALMVVLRHLHHRDPHFMENLADAATPGHRPGVARVPSNLFPNSPQILRHSSVYRELEPNSGWYVDLNVSAKGVTALVRKACKVAGVTFGQDIQL